MKAGKSSGSGSGGRTAPAEAPEDWEQQVDYPVPASGPVGRNGGKQVAQASREDRIRLKAYERASRRGFAGGDEVGDWLEAEREVAEEERRKAKGGERR